MQSIESPKDFEYSSKFHDLIVHLHRGKEHWPGYQRYLAEDLAGPRSRLRKFVALLIPDIEHHCGSLSGKRVLDFGCGTGATTAALAMKALEVIAFDIDAESLGICMRRIKEHTFTNVQFYHVSDIHEIKDLGKFDLILMNGVIEHIPLSKKGLRKHIIRDMFSMVKSRGFLYINGTPNRIWPYDIHSTQLWWIPWTKPGSEWAYKKAVAKGRHSDAPTHTTGPVGLEEIGAWGATYWEITRYLDREQYVCLNLLKGHDRRISYVARNGFVRQIVEFALYLFAVKLLKVPMTAVWIYLNNLTFQKIE